MFLGLGERSGIEDIENFAAVFSTAKRSGGDMDKIIQTSARMIGDKIDVRKEIETTLSAKKAEQMIMSLMPAELYCIRSHFSGFLRFYGNPLRCSNDSLPGNLWTFLLAGEKNCGY